MVLLGLRTTVGGVSILLRRQSKTYLQAATKASLDSRFAEKPRGPAVLQHVTRLAHRPDLRRALLAGPRERLA